ncbi:hypothetical protein ABB37_07603 [Leptomonas pyrrhocoris]|uniref:Uncharacterized protein n=1 Tax=Leptomonas pyrrhocoris TaxID=157538 RepID=A0A0N0DT21_LEPPY|nr:hypothetical protein ABB37_07603 [Leptomonas pyrrhocoris]KPA76784.1 hypothetical protein ABB37_07603 [Leptomonas pyrrhocoris]|eukprot:XP_015655223.1 hypothetical protein ABB37_07603 [Leptomonas pyrrhocoris]
MQSLRDAPGYAEMEDYYDSDFVPLHLIDRYSALQLERQKKTEQLFIAASQAHGLAATHDGLALAGDSTASLHFTTQSSLSAAHLSSSSKRQQEEQQQRSGQRSPQRRSIAASTRSNSGSRNSAPRQAPRTSMALDAIYAARDISHGYPTASATSSGDALLSTTLHPTPPAASPSSSRTLKTKNAAKSSANARAARTHRHTKTERKPPESTDEPLQRDLYDSAAEAYRQEHFFNESRRLGKPFVPSGGSGLDMPTRFMLGDCVKALYRSIVPDWREASPMVVSTAEDLIAVYFSLEKLEKAQVTALLQYMNACLLHNAAIREFHLTKVTEGWDVLTNEGYVLYTFRPPWVKKRAFLPDTINPLYAHLREGED